MLAAWLAAAGCLLAAGPASADDRSVAGNLPPGAVELLEAAPLASPSPGPQGRYLLLARRDGYLERRQPAVRPVSIAGRRIDPRTYGPYALPGHHGISVVELPGGGRREIPLPHDAVVGYPFWAPDGSRFAFTLTTAQGVELWIGNPDEARARRLVGELNAVFRRPCVWLADSRHLICRRVEAGRSDALSEVASIKAGEDWALETMLAARHDSLKPAAADVEPLLESRLQMIDVVTGQRRDIARRARVRAVDPSPSQSYLLVRYVGDAAAGPRRRNTFTEVRDLSGRVVRTLSPAKRAVQWQAGKPATLIWVERRDGRDRVMSQPPPFNGKAEQLFAAEHDFAGLQWLEKMDWALLSEFIPERRVTRRWLVALGSDRAEPRRISSHHVDVGDGLPMKTRNRWGASVVAVRDRRFFLGGRTTTDSGAAAYLDEVDINTGARHRLWTGAGSGRGHIVAMPAGDPGTLLVRHETTNTPPNLYLVDRTAGRRVQLTHNIHPAPSLRGVERVLLRYTRDDGVALSATLYVPPHDDSHQPLPMVLWAYPKKVGDQAAASVSSSSGRYLGSERALKLFFLLCGYAVMDDVSMPVVGGDRNANDDFVAQVAANARAAVGAAVDSGLIDPARVAVAGHSYGAFMAANLLAHSRLFRAGIALSGAYNRTLTPFGFQTERRTLWEAPETYLAMSPLLYSDRIEAPLLLVHGMADRNAGTSPIQSLQFYRAIRGNGGEAKLVLLPREGHIYRTRESVLTTASAMLDWLERHLNAAPTSGEPVESSLAFMKQ